ncbi:MAG: hypothetical protein WC812_00175 [Candidatus Pacearchaeota archaeon]|jgi:hypothetical protein
MNLQYLLAEDKMSEKELDSLSKIITNENAEGKICFIEGLEVPTFQISINKNFGIKSFVKDFTYLNTSKEGQRSYYSQVFVSKKVRYIFLDKRPDSIYRSEEAKKTYQPAVLM